MVPELDAHLERMTSRKAGSTRRSTQVPGHFKVISRSFQGQFRVSSGSVQGGRRRDISGYRWVPPARRERRRSSRIEVCAHRTETNEAAQVIAGAGFEPATFGL